MSARTRAFTPARLDEALALLADPELMPVPIAGCTDFLVSAHGRQQFPPAVLDVSRVTELRGIGIGEDVLDVGAAVTFAELRRDPLVREHLPILAEVAATIGAAQIQARATLGGNLVNASPAGDSLPVCLALGAELVLASARRGRRVPHRRFHTGYRRTALEPDELLVRVRFPLPAPALQRFRKVGTRAAQAISKVVLAFTAHPDNGVLRQVRVAAGSVAPIPLRLSAAETALEGRSPSRRIAEAAARAAAGEITPIDDVRSTARYRRFALAACLRRAVLEATAEAPPNP